MIDEKLKFLRERKGLSQIELANILNIQQGSYSNYERGKRTPDIEAIKKISKYYNVTIDYLVENNIKNESAISKLEKILNDTQKKQLLDICKTIFPEEYKKATE